MSQLALFLALSLLRCLAMSCAVRAVVRCPALLLSALSLQLLCSALLCASCAVHCFHAVALLLFFFFFFLLLCCFIALHCFSAIVSLRLLCVSLRLCWFFAWHDQIFVFSCACAVVDRCPILSLVSFT